MARGDTRYSERIEGESRNHNFAYRFDVTDGFVRIQQFDGDKVADCVLLSPAQWKALVAFVEKRK